MEKILEFLTVNLTQFGGKAAGALAVFIIGKFLIGKLIGFIDKVILQKQSDPMIHSFANSCIKIVSYIILSIMTASILGIHMTSLIAILSAATLAIGMALQGSLSNFAGGFLILILRPFEMEDYIKVGEFEGSVDSIHIFYTMINTVDNKKIILPNGALANNTIINYTKNGIRRVDLDIGISYSEDFKRVVALLEEIMAAHPKVLKNLDNTVRIKEFAASSVNLTYRAWCSSDDYWDLYFDSMEIIKRRFDLEEVEIPFSQLDLHIKNTTDISKSLKVS